MEKTDVITKSEERKSPKKGDELVSNKRPLNEVTPEDSLDGLDDDSNSNLPQGKNNVNKNKRQKTKDHEENGDESNDVLDEEDEEEEDEEDEGSDPEGEYGEEDDDAVVNETGGVTDSANYEDDEVDDEED